MSKNEKGKYYISTAIAYTSRVPHIGNTYEAVLADAIARYKRNEGYDVFFLTGTDEHGQKIQDQAKSEGITPKEHVDNIAGEIRKIWDLMNVSYDKFIRTTDKEHEETVQKIFQKLYDNGDIYKNEYSGMYCKPCESFFTKTQAVDGKCPDCGAELTPTTEEAYFFKLSKYVNRLKAHIEENPDFIQPASRKNEMLNNFINAGLTDLCVSRSTFDWGVPVPFDNKHVIYVWIDALSNYITALGFDVDGNHGELYNKYWPCDVHLIGKDILRFHTIYWPIMLLALGQPLPKKVFGHPWLLAGADKMSKSKGNVLYATDLVELFGVDGVRYYCLHEMPFAQDGMISYELMVERFNSDLANILGNLVNRTLAMTQKYFDGAIPAPTTPGEFDDELIDLASSVESKVTAKMDKLMVADAIDEVFALLRRLNKYIDETTPWILAKDPEQKGRLGTVLYNLLEGIRISAIMLSAFLPDTAENILNQLGAENRSFESALKFGGTVAGKKIGTPSPLFARLDINKILAKVEAASVPEVTSKAKPYADETISIDDFFKSDIRVGKVLECEAVPKSDKLLRFILDDGIGKRQIVSGIAKYYKPDELIGKNVLFVANLTPVKLRGVESCGMILSAEYDGKIQLINAPEDCEPGAVIG